MKDNLLPELLMLAFVLFVLVFTGNIYFGKWDNIAETWLNAQAIGGVRR